jgi:signal transduction histidine kinase
MNAPANDDAVPVSSGNRPSIRPTSQLRTRVWIVDDSPVQAAVARQALAERCDVSVYASGTAAIEQLSLGEPSPDVLVLDWNMPEMSGEEVCLFVRGTFDAARLPILVLTATATSNGVLEALAAGANDFVRKPFTDTELNARVATLARSKFLHTQLVAAEQIMRVEAEFRERFIGMLAHDLRQPLNTLSMASQLRHSDPTTAAKLADLQQRAVQRMKRMIGELLDFTRNRPETGMPLEREQMDFAELAVTIVGEVRVAHPEINLELSIDGPCVGSWDADRLAQICSNLIDNAIEHTTENATVSVALAGDEAGILLKVTNRGSPIPASVRAILFEPFRRGVGKKAPGGVGLGLHIVSQIVSSHDGKVWVTSDDLGTHFMVSLPKASAVA